MEKYVYIEHWGFNSDNMDYYKSKKYNIAKYNELKLTIISTNEATLNRKLNNFEFDKINFDTDK